ncbi:cytochrome c [Fulvivirga sp.]|uniref:c-type cytochrome n=1 Tax=Fulvivirga sp. TaxID=1931237 RepID=UPI0032EB2ACD
MKSKLIFILALACACTGKTNNSDNGEETTHSEDVKMEQYLVEGQKLYGIHCANCHQVKGEGLAQLFPPLAKSDYLLQNVDASICGVKNGMSGEITVNGTTYNQPMPGIPQLTNLELAEIFTYVTNSWGNNNGMITTERVEATLKECKQ